MGHQERKLREKENVKKSILNAALKIAKKDGWESVTIRKIAEAVEYTTSIVYEHFENKDDLLNEITEQGFAKLNEEFENLFNKQGKPSEILLQLSIAHWDYVQKNKALYKLMFICI
jgi:AcrR family transcriptional regulator